jgi:DNA-binding MarR family transcriptional regulator
LNDSSIERFERSFRAALTRLRASGEGDLSPRQREVLRLVAHGEGISLGALADRLGLPNSTASVLVKGLERRGLVRRRRDARDERRLSIVLTRRGRDRADADSLLDERRLAEALDRLTPSQRRSLLAGLERLAAATLPPFAEAAAPSRRDPPPA